MTELKAVVPNGLPLMKVPDVKVEPLLTVMELASTAVNLWAVVAVEEKVIVPLILPVAPVATAIVIAFIALQLRAEPA